MRTAGEKFAHYEIRSLLGQGGMGEVYLAFDTKLHRRVALKLLLTSESASHDAKADAVARIIREARAAAALEHPNKVSIFELGEVDGTPYLAMEYIEGSTLRAFVGDASVDWKQKLGWLLDVARALDAAHDAGLVHRDIKPENVMIRKDGIVKVLDFGIARRADSAIADAGVTTPAIEALTGKGVVIGTAAYMPPEQMQGEDLDGRADQFAWGVMAFELLSGSHPWATAAGALAMVGAMLTKAAPPLEGFPEVVAGAVARALCAKRDDRFGSMGEIVEALAGVASPSGPIAVVSGDKPAIDADVASAPTDVAMARTEVAEKTPAPTPAPEPGPAAVTSRAPGRWGWRIALGAAAVAALGVGAWRLGAARPSVEHCFDTVVTATGPRCVAPVSSATMSHRYRTFRLTTRTMGVESVERLNTAGIVTSENGEVARLDVRRGADGAVSEVVARDEYGEEMWHEVWSEGGARIDYTEADGTTPRRFGEARYTTVRREYDGGGFVRRERYYGPTGKPRPSDEGVFGTDIDRAPDGFPLRETYLGADGEPMADPRGVAATTRVPNARRVEGALSYLDLAGRPIRVDGVATIRTAYTAELDGAEVTYFDEGGAQLANLSYGTHGIRFVRDAAARTIRWTYVDEAGKPRLRKDDAFASQEIAHNERGRKIRDTFLDASGNPVIQAQDGAAIWSLEWDEQAHVVVRHALDPSGRPMPCRWGFASRTDVRDARGRPLEQRHFDVDGKPAPFLEGPATVKVTLDERGLFAELAWFDGDGRPTSQIDGASSHRVKHDRMRNTIEVAAFGADGKPVLLVEGFSIERNQFSEDDDRVEASWFDTTGAPTLADGYATVRIKRDDRGWKTEEAYFDTNDNPILTKGGFAIERYVRDRSGDIIEDSFLGKQGEPVVREGGYASKKNAYDIHRRRTE